MRKRKYLCYMAAFLAVMFSFSACMAENGDNEESHASTVESSVPSESSNTSSDISETDGITPALWKVTDENGNSMYCFGSIHATEGEIEWPDYFENAYTACDSLTFEYDITSSLQLENAVNSLQSYMYKDGTTIKDHIPEADYKQAVKILTENQMYVSAYDYFNVTFWISLMENVCITQSGLDVMQGVDMQLINRAKADGKTVLEVESEQEQLDLFNNFSDELQIYLLEGYLGEGEIEKQAVAVQETYEKWKKGEDLSESATQEMTEEEKVLNDEYINALLTQRNIKMADTAESYMQSGDTVMMVVGAAHYYGEDGILSLLQSRGCTVERITD